MDQCQVICRITCLLLFMSVLWDLTGWIGYVSLISKNIIWWSPGNRLFMLGCFIGYTIYLLKTVLPSILVHWPGEELSLSTLQKTSKVPVIGMSEEMLFHRTAFPNLSSSADKWRRQPGGGGEGMVLLAHAPLSQMQLCMHSPTISKARFQTGCSLAQSKRITDRTLEVF